MHLIKKFLTLSLLIIYILPTFPLKSGLTFKKKNVSFFIKGLLQIFNYPSQFIILIFYKQMHKTCKNNE